MLHFWSKVYKNSFIAGIPQGISISEKLINAAVGGQLVSSLLAVSCVTVAFCCNMISVQDKVSGARRDLTVSPVKKSTLAISYYTATLISTLIVCLLTSVICLIYLGKIGWYLNAKDIALAALDIVLLVLFGTALSSIINCFLKLTGANFRRRHNRKLRLRLYLRRIYADFAVRQRPAKGAFVFARHICHKPAAKPRSCGSFSRNGKPFFSKAGNRRD